MNRRVTAADFKHDVNKQAWLGQVALEKRLKDETPVGERVPTVKYSLTRADYLELFKMQNPDVTELTQSELTKWIEQQSTASAVHKRAPVRTEKRMSMFGNLIYGSTPAPVEKSADVTEYEFRDG